jgi:hypothetical protein
MAKTALPIPARVEQRCLVQSRGNNMKVLSCADDVVAVWRCRGVAVSMKSGWLLDQDRFAENHAAVRTALA